MPTDSRPRLGFSPCHCLLSLKLLPFSSKARQANPVLAPLLLGTSCNPSWWRWPLLGLVNDGRSRFLRRGGSVAQPGKRGSEGIVRARFCVRICEALCAYPSLLSWPLPVPCLVPGPSPRAFLRRAKGRAKGRRGGVVDSAGWLRQLQRFLRRMEDAAAAPHSSPPCLRGGTRFALSPPHPNLHP